MDGTDTVFIRNGKRISMDEIEYRLEELELDKLRIFKKMIMHAAKPITEEEIKNMLEAAGLN